MKKLLALLLVVFLAFPALAVTPDVWYSTDGRSVWRESKEGRQKVDLNPMFVEGADYSLDDGFHWFEAESSVWVCDTKDQKRMPIRIPLREGERCLYAAVNRRWAIVFLSLVYNNDETLALFDMKGKKLAETPGVMGLGNGDSLFWLDGGRFLFTSSVHGTKRGLEENNWHGAAVLELFGEPGGDYSKYFEILVTPVAEPTATVNYEADSVDTDTNECCITKYTVPTPEDWLQQEPVYEMQDIRVPFPAAG